VISEKFIKPLTTTQQSSQQTHKILTKKNIYLISGMGANSKVFERLQLDDYKLHFIKWIIPEKNESLEDYAKRMAKDIDTSKPVILLGMSFGGIVVQEISKFIETEKIILISSIKLRKELPTLYKISSALSLHKLIPSVFFHNTKLMAKTLFGKNTDSIIKTLERYFTMRDIRYSRWAMDKVVNWKQTKYHKNLLHLHGTKDSVFPANFISKATFIKGGTHLMVFTRAKEVNQHILNFLES
jgi:pimeloyl-ACP methyl ester carboxylesterase